MNSSTRSNRKYISFDILAEKNALLSKIRNIVEEKEKEGDILNPENKRLIARAVQKSLDLENKNQGLVKMLYDEEKKDYMKNILNYLASSKLYAYGLYTLALFNAVHPTGQITLNLSQDSPVAFIPNLKAQPKKSILKPPASSSADVKTPASSSANVKPYISFENVMSPYTTPPRIEPILKLGKTFTIPSSEKHQKEALRIAQYYEKTQETEVLLEKHSYDDNKRLQEYLENERQGKFLLPAHQDVLFHYRKQNYEKEIPRIMKILKDNAVLKQNNQPIIRLTDSEIAVYNWYKEERAKEKQKESLLKEKPSSSTPVQPTNPITPSTLTTPNNPQQVISKSISPIPLNLPSLESPAKSVTGTTATKPATTATKPVSTMSSAKPIEPQKTDTQQGKGIVESKQPAAVIGKPEEKKGDEGKEEKIPERAASRTVIKPEPEYSFTKPEPEYFSIKPEPEDDTTMKPDLGEDDYSKNLEEEEEPPRKKYKPEIDQQFSYYKIYNYKIPYYDRRKITQGIYH